MSSHVERIVEIVNLRGLHARAAAKFVKTAEQHSAAVTVLKDGCAEGVEVCGTSIMGLLMLAAAKGAQVRIRAEGAGAKQAVDDLADLVAGRFGEEN